MCGRFVDPNLRGTEVEMSQTKINPIPRRFNVKPTQEVLVMGRVPEQAQYARWGLIPSWFRGDIRDWKAATINARIEDARDKPSFKAAWKYGRCLIPAGGYYEWAGAKAPKQPWFIASAGNEETLWFAGLVSLWGDLQTCAILTRAASEPLAALHTRMPVILSTAEREAWLSGTEGPDLGAGAQLRYHPVKRFGIADEGEELIEAME